MRRRTTSSGWWRPAVPPMPKAHCAASSPRSPANAEWRTLLARVLAVTGRKPEAIAELGIAVEHAPDGREARLTLARLANELGQSELAARHARVLTERDARDSEAWSALGMAAFGLRQQTRSDPRLATRGGYRSGLRSGALQPCRCTRRPGTIRGGAGSGRRGSQARREAAQRFARADARTDSTRPLRRRGTPVARVIARRCQ